MREVATPTFNLTWNGGSYTRRYKSTLLAQNVCNECVMGWFTSSRLRILSPKLLNNFDHMWYKGSEMNYTKLI